MCIGSNNAIQSHKLKYFFPRKPKRTKVRILRHMRRNKQPREKVGSDMVLKNLKLYMKNMSIKEENDKLRKQASLLHQENLALMSEFQKRFTKSDFRSITLNTACLAKQHYHG